MPLSFLYFDAIVERLSGACGFDFPLREINNFHFNKLLSSTTYHAIVTLGSIRHYTFFLHFSKKLNLNVCVCLSTSYIHIKQAQKGQVENSIANRQKIAFWQPSRVKPLNKRHD